jgi:hypothetical protein
MYDRNASILAIALFGAGLFAAAPARADEFAAPAFRLSGSATLASDYRFRGVSLSDNGPAAQASLRVDHRSGLYVGGFVSSLAGWGAQQRGGVEFDAQTGYRADVAGFALDAGVTGYFFPAGSGTGNFAEFHARLGRTLGPVSVTAGIAYAPPQRALGNWSGTPASRAGARGDYLNLRAGARGDNLNLRADAIAGVPGTPLTARAHVGWSRGTAGVGPDGYSLTPTGRVLDWLVGLDYVRGPFTFGAAYVATDIGSAAAARLSPAFRQRRTGGAIAGGRALVSITAAF